MEIDNDQFVIDIPTLYTLNGKPFTIGIGLDTENHHMQICLNDVFVKPLEAYSIHPWVIFDSTFITSLECIVDSMHFCQGIVEDITYPSSVPKKHDWSKMIGVSENTWTLYHSHHCQYLLPFTGEYDKTVCR